MGNMCSLAIVSWLGISQSVDVLTRGSRVTIKIDRDKSLAHFNVANECRK